MNGPLYMQTVNRTVLVRRVKRKGDGPSKQLARWFVENQIGMSIFIFAAAFFFAFKTCAPNVPFCALCFSTSHGIAGDLAMAEKVQTPCLVAPPSRQGSLAQHAVCLTASH